MTALDTETWSDDFSNVSPSLSDFPDSTASHFESAVESFSDLSTPLPGFSADSLSTASLEQYYFRSVYDLITSCQPESGDSLAPIPRERSRSVVRSYYDAFESDEPEKKRQRLTHDFTQLTIDVTDPPKEEQEDDEPRQLYNLSVSKLQRSQQPQTKPKAAGRVAAIEPSLRRSVLIYNVLRNLNVMPEGEETVPTPMPVEDDDEKSMECV